MSKEILNVRIGAVLSVAISFSLATGAVGTALGSVSYTTPDSSYTQDFNGLPIDTRQSNSIQTGATGSTINYVNGWQDDTTTVSGDHVSLPGWYLYHSKTSTEGGTNTHQRLRFGTGNSGTGAFYAFATASANPEKALGFLPSTTLATDPVADPTVNNDDTMFMALRLTNDTGATLNQFTVSYTGEQWRDGGRGDQPSLTSSIGFSWKVNAATVHEIAGFTSVPELGFTSPVANNSTTGAGVDGNSVGQVPVSAFTVTGINWTAGSDLWIRWSDQQLVGNDHGMGIDDLSFSAGVGTAPGGVPGDFNGNGVVDAADYVLWRNGGPLANEVSTTGTVDSQDYTDWRARFGNDSGGGSGLGAGAVPEPATIVLGAAVFGLACGTYRRRPTK